MGKGLSTKFCRINLRIILKKELLYVGKRRYSKGRRPTDGKNNEKIHFISVVNVIIVIIVITENMSRYLHCTWNMRLLNIPLKAPLKFNYFLSISFIPSHRDSA